MFIFLLNLLTFVTIALYDGTWAVIFSLFFLYISGIGISFLLQNKKNNDLRLLLTLFNAAFFIYISFAFISYLGYLSSGGFYAPDHQLFYDNGDLLSHQNSLKSIYQLCFVDRIHHENEGAFFLFGTLGYFANNCFDGNSVLFQTIYVSFFTLLINLFVFKILQFYVPKRSAFKYCIYYMLFAYVLAGSPWILRDNHIALFFSIAIYIVHLSFSLRRFVTLLILQIIVYEFRFEHGIFFIFFPLIYLWVKGGENKFKHLYYLIVILSAVLVTLQSVSYINSSVNTMVTTANYYIQLTQTQAEESGGLGNLLYQLPIGVKQIAILFFSQISPFPPWYSIAKAPNIYFAIHGIILGFSSIFWGYVVFTSIKGLKSHFYSFPRLTIWLVVFAIILLLGNTTNISVRRIMAVYPVIYILYVVTQTQNTRIQNRRNLIQYSLIYSLLLIAYLLIKLL